MADLYPSEADFPYSPEGREQLLAAREAWHKRNDTTVTIELTNDEIQAIIVGLSGEGNPEDDIAHCLFFHDPRVNWSTEMSEALIERLLNESQGLH